MVSKYCVIFRKSAQSTLLQCRMAKMSACCIPSLSLFPKHIVGTASISSEHPVPQLWQVFPVRLIKVEQRYSDPDL